MTDGVVLLTVIAALLLVMPSGLVFGPLGGVGTPASILSIGTLWLWAAGRAVPAIPLGSGVQPVRTLMLLLAVSTVASYAAAASQAMVAEERRGADRGLLMVAAGAGVALMAADGIRTRALLDRLLRRIAAMVTVVAGIGFLQFATGVDLASGVRIPGLSRLDPATFVGERYDLKRVAGTTAHGIEFSVVLAMGFPLALHYAFHTTGFRSRLWQLAALVIAIGIPMSISRTGTVAMVVVGAMLFPTWEGTRRRRAILLLPVFLVAMRAAFPGLLGTVKGLFLNFFVDSSIEARTVDYGMIGDFFARAPWFGRGTGTFLPTLYQFIDNQYLISAVEGGAVGVAVLLAVYLVGMGLARGARLRGSDPETKDLGQAIAASIAVALVCSATYDFLSFATSRGLLFFMLGCAGALWRLVREEESEQGGVAPMLWRRQRALHLSA